MQLASSVTLCSLTQEAVKGPHKLCQVSVAQILGLQPLGFVKDSTRSSQLPGEGVKTGKGKTALN